MGARKGLKLSALLGCGIYLLYALVTYFYVPYKLEQLLEQDISARIGHPIQVAKIHYNPLQVSLSVRQFELADLPEQPLLRWQELSVDVGVWASLWHRHPVLESFHLTQPEIRIRHTPDGFNFDNILSAFSSPEATPQNDSNTTDDESALAVILRTLVIEGGQFSFLDTTQLIAADTHLTDLSLHFDHLYLATGSDTHHPFSINTELSNGGSVTFSGQYRLQPLSIDSDITISDVALAEFSDFLRNIVHANLSGFISGKSHLVIKQVDDSPLSLLVDDTEFDIRELALEDLEDNPHVLTMDRLSAHGLSVDLTNRNINLDRLGYEGFSLHQWRNEDGSFRYQSLLVAAATQESNLQHSAQVATGASQASSPSATNSSGQSDNTPPWSVRIGQFSLASGNIDFVDKTVTPNAHWNLNEINAHVAPLNLTSSETGEHQLSALINQQAHLSIEGSHNINPLNLQSQIGLNAFALSDVNPYIADTSYAKIERGALSVSSQLATHLQDSGFTGNITTELSITDFALQNGKTHSPVLSFLEFGIADAQLALQPLALTIDKVWLSTPNIIIENSATPNWQLLAEEQTTADNEPKPEPGETEKDQATDIELALQTLTITDGKLSVKDSTVTPPLSSSVADLNLVINQLSNSQDTLADASLSARINHQAPFEVSGQFSLGPQNPSAKFTGSLSELDLRPFAAYTGTYLGYGVKQGRLNYNFDYAVQGEKLTGDNRISANKFYLGETVQSEKAIDAPIKLGLGLLRDLNGNITLNIPISGNTNDPSFDLGAVISKTFANLIIKAAASPFTALGSLINTDRDLSEIPFATGSTAIEEAATNTLQDLALVLSKKPDLILSIQGSADPMSDREALQRAALYQRLQITQSQSAAGDSAESWILDYADTLKNTYNSETNNNFQELYENAINSGKDQSEANLQALSNALSLLIEREPLPQNALIDLAEKRALAIESSLLEQGLSPQQIQRLPISSEHLTGLASQFQIEGL